MARRGFTRRDVLKAGGAGALSLGVAGCATDDFETELTRDGDGPNVLMILTDSTRADFIGAYNSDSIAETPEHRRPRQGRAALQPGGARGDAHRARAGGRCSPASAAFRSATG